MNNTTLNNVLGSVRIFEISHHEMALAFYQIVIGSHRIKRLMSCKKCFKSSVQNYYLILKI